MFTLQEPESSHITPAQNAYRIRSYRFVRLHSSRFLMTIPPLPIPVILSTETWSFSMILGLSTMSQISIYEGIGPVYLFLPSHDLSLWDSSKRHGLCLSLLTECTVQGMPSPETHRRDWSSQRLSSLETGSSLRRISSFANPSYCYASHSSGILQIQRSRLSSWLDRLRLACLYHFPLWKKK